MSNIDRVDWHQNEQEKEQSAQVIKAIEAAIVAAPKNTTYTGEERRKSVRATRRETLATCLVNLNQALANLEATGSLDASARVWIIEGLDASCIMTMHGYYAKGRVQIPDWYIASIKASAQGAVPIPTLSASDTDEEGEI